MKTAGDAIVRVVRLLAKLHANPIGNLALCCTRWGIRSDT